MQALLTHVGQRWCQQHARRLPAAAVPSGLNAQQWIVLLELLRGTVVPWSGQRELEPLVGHGLVELSDHDLGPEALALRAARTPLENLERATLEYTTECEGKCLHCRNQGQAPVTEVEPERLYPAVDTLVDLGILRFDFIGGEVLRHGFGWLEVVERIRTWPGTTVSVVTSGWFLDGRDFEAAGRSYRNALEFLQDLARSGVTHLTFSLDGPREIHDHWRRAPGLHDRVLAGFELARKAGLRPQVSLINRPFLEDPVIRTWLQEVSEALYGPELDAGPDARLTRLLGDDYNYVSNLVDVGAAMALRQGRIRIKEVEDRHLRCKNFFRPFPSLFLNATGAVTTCPLMGGQPGFGDLYRPGLVHTLNHMHESPIFRLHAEGRLGDYRRWLDPRVFGDRIDHICTLRVALTRLALALDGGACDPGNPAALRALNEEVAASMGQVLPESIRLAIQGKPALL